jgi:hypothetical protein
MAYVLEKMTPADIEKITAAADDRQKIFLKNRRFFEDNLDMVWTIDKERGFCLLNAPSQEHMTSTSFFFFYFNKFLYTLAIAGYSNTTVQLPVKPPKDEMELFKLELTDAFAVHGLAGMPEIEAKVVPVFEAEGE